MVMFQCTYADYDRYVSLFERMSYHAWSYAPDVEEITNVIIPKLNPNYILFLLWIDVTGYETEANKESRRMIRQLLTKRIYLIDDEEEDKEDEENDEEKAEEEDKEESDL